MVRCNIKSKKIYPFTKRQSEKMNISYKPVWAISINGERYGISSTKKKAERNIKDLKKVMGC